MLHPMLSAHEVAERQNEMLRAAAYQRRVNAVRAACTACRRTVVEVARAGVAAVVRAVHRPHRAASCPTR